MSESTEYNKRGGEISEIFLDGASHEASGIEIANAVLVEHPHTPDGTWDLLDQPTRDWWTTKAAPVADAIRRQA